MKKWISLVIVLTLSAFCGAEVMHRDSGQVPPSGDFTALITFRHQGFAPVPKEMAWRNGMIACCRSGYYDGWRVFLHDVSEARPVFEIGRKEGAVGLEGREAVAQGVWHRLAVSWRAATPGGKTGTMQLWLNGQLQAESPADRPAPLMNGATLHLGYVDYGVGALNLEVGDVRCMARALSAAEIAADFAAAAAAAPVSSERDRPLLTQVLTRAFARIAADTTPPPSVAKPVRVIELKPGVQRLTETMTFEGSPADGLLIRGAADGSTELTGEEVIPSGAFTRPPAALLARFPVAVRDRVICAEVSDLESLASYGVGVPRREGLLLFTADAEPRPLRHARWPSVGCRPAQMKDSVLRFDHPAPRIPVGARVLAYGYWRYFWADAALPAEVTADGGFRLLEKHCYGFSAQPAAALIGVPEVADEAGEWCVVDGKLCVVRPDGPFRGVRIGRLDRPLIRFARAKCVRFENVRLSGTYGTALEASDCPGLTLRGISIARAGGCGATVRNCDGAWIKACSFSDTGFDSLQISGGDRNTLRESGARIEKCCFRRPGRLQKTYTPAILMEGCGITVSGCDFSETPSSALRMEGNEHLVRESVFSRTVLESDDQGTIDLWGDPTYRGNVFFRNTFRDVGGDANNDCGRAAIRFDDMISGMAVISNVFENCAQGNFGAVQMNGGHYNALAGNTFRNCARGVTIQRWDERKWRDVLAEEETQRKRGISRGNPAYRLRYPELDAIGTEDGAQLLLDNAFENVAEPVRGLSLTGLRRDRGAP